MLFDALQDMNLPNNVTPGRERNTEVIIKNEKRESSDSIAPVLDIKF